MVSLGALVELVGALVGRTHSANALAAAAGKRSMTMRERCIYRCAATSLESGHRNVARADSALLEALEGRLDSSGSGGDCSGW